jgi:hypothetical protein
MGMMDANGNPIYYDYDTRTDITHPHARGHRALRTS